MKICADRRRQGRHAQDRNHQGVVGADGRLMFPGTSGATPRPSAPTTTMSTWGMAANFSREVQASPVILPPPVPRPPRPDTLWQGQRRPSSKNWLHSPGQGVSGRVGGQSLLWPAPPAQGRNSFPETYWWSCPRPPPEQLFALRLYPMSMSFTYSFPYLRKAALPAHRRHGPGLIGNGIAIVPTPGPMSPTGPAGTQVPDISKPDRTADCSRYRVAVQR